MEEKVLLYLYNYDGNYSTQVERLSFNDALQKAHNYDGYAQIKTENNPFMYRFYNGEPELYSLKQSENIAMASARLFIG